MRSINIFDKGEHVLFEMEITKVELVGSEPVYYLKAANEEDYLEKPFKFGKLIPIPLDEQETE